MSVFSDNLKKLRKTKKMTLEELANDINKKRNTRLHKGTLSKWESGTDPTMESVINLAEYFGVSINELIGVNVNNSDVSRMDGFIPIIGTISAGTPMYADENIIGYTARPPLATREADLFYLKVHGDSMDKEFPDGSDVLVDKNAVVKSGDIAVVLINGFDATVKKVKFEFDNNTSTANRVVLIPMSNNDSHYAQVYDMELDEITILGKVIGAYKSY